MTESVQFGIAVLVELPWRISVKVTVPAVGRAAPERPETVGVKVAV